MPPPGGVTRRAAIRSPRLAFGPLLAWATGEILASDATEADLPGVQREVLVPLELGLLDGSIGAPTSACGVVSMIMAALAARPVDRRHRGTS